MGCLKEEYFEDFWIRTWPNLHEEELGNADLV